MVASSRENVAFVAIHRQYYHTQAPSLRHDRLLRRLPFPSIGSQDLVDGREGELDLLIRRVEVRREAHARSGTEVADDVFGVQFECDFFRVRHEDGYRTAAAVRSARCAQFEAARVGE